MTNRKNICLDCHRPYFRKGRGGGLRCEPCRKKHKKKMYAEANKEVEK